jgi:hypothetical protein
MRRLLVPPRAPAAFTSVPGSLTLHRVSRALVLTFTALFVLTIAPSPPDARAYDVGQDVTGRPEVVQALADARAYWGDRVACPGGVAVDVADLAGASEAATALHCRISVGIGWLNAGPDRTRFCALFAHEYGHLLGYGHEAHPEDTDGIMVTPVTPRYCRTFNALPMRLPAACRWPAWARTTPQIRRLYADGKLVKARATFRAWRTKHPKAKLPGSCVATP